MAYDHHHNLYLGEFMRTFLFLISMVLYILITLPLLLVAKYSKSQKVAHFFVKYLAYVGNISAGNKVIIKGLDNQLKEPFVLVGNHEGIFDLFNIYQSVNQPMGFVSKKENEKIPILSLWIPTLKVLLMDREDLRQSVRIIREASNIVKSGTSMGIFPEGTRSVCDEEFLGGSFKIAYLSKAPIQPITLRNTANIYENNKRIKKGRSLIYYHEPILYETYKDMESQELAKMVQNIVQGVKFD